MQLCNARRGRDELVHHGHAAIFIVVPAVVHAGALQLADQFPHGALHQRAHGGHGAGNGHH